MHNILKKTLFISAMMLLNFNICFAAGEVTLLESDSKSRAHLKTETLWATNNDAELIDYCTRIYGKTEGALKAVKFAGDIDFDNEFIIFVIGKDSYQGYEITFLPEATDFSKGNLNLFFKVSRPTREQLKQSKRSPHYNKNPYLILKTNVKKIKIQSIKNINFIDAEKEELLDAWSNN